MARRTRSGPCVWKCLHVNAIGPSHYCISLEPEHTKDSGGYDWSSEARSGVSGRYEPVNTSIVMVRVALEPRRDLVGRS
jgi:hypothetical protein